MAEGIEAANGTATYEDTLPVAASYEYQAIAYNGPRVSALSATLTVEAV
ncbi:MAG: hypothetical protein WCO56_26490 [Verrucomicrobiota bacterium]